MVDIRRTARFARTCATAPGRWFLTVVVAALVLVTSPALPAQQTDVQWDPDWRRMTPLEYGMVGALTAGSIIGRVADPEPRIMVQRDPAFDRRLSDAVAIENRPLHLAVSGFSHVTYWGVMGYRLLDAILVATVYDAPDVGWQMFWIDLEAFSVTAGAIWLTQYFVGRDRPGVRRCGDPTKIGFLCDSESSEKRRSLFSGHTAILMTGAALSCVHHSRQPLYTRDARAAYCGSLLGIAGVTGFLRMASGAHFPSDVALGLGVGAAVGFLLPRALHYGFGPVEAADGVERTHAEVRLPLLRLGGTFY